MDLIPFKFKHLDALKEIHNSQNFAHTALIEMKTLPKIGYIAMLNDQPIAAGFLRRLEPNFAQLDTLASNAYFGSQIRHQGISLVVDALLQDAKRLKLEGIVAMTADDGILKRAEALGFHIVNQKLIAKKL